MTSLALAAILAFASCRTPNRTIAGELHGGRTYIAQHGRWSVDMAREVALDDPSWEVVEAEDGSNVYLATSGFTSRYSVRVVRFPGRAQPRTLDIDDEDRFFDAVIAEARARSSQEIEFVHRDTIDLDGVVAVYRYYVEPIPPQNLGPLALFQSTPPGRFSSLALLVDRGEAVACFALEVVSTGRTGDKRDGTVLVLEPHWEEFLAFARSFRVHPAGLSGAAGSTAE